MWEPAAILILGALGLAVVLLLIRLFAKGKTVRRVLGGTAALLLMSVALVFFAACNPSLCHWVLPSTHVGTWTITDLDGREREVDVYDKATSNTIPPGVLDRLKLVIRGGDSITYQTQWRHGLSSVRAADGGIDVMTGLTCCQGGLRFLVEGGRWRPEPEGVSDVGPVEILDPLKKGLAEDLRPLVDLIHNSPRPEGDRFNPVPLIRAVNALQEAGQERALRALEAYRTMATAKASTNALFHDFALTRCEHHQLDARRAVPIEILLFQTGDDIRLVSDLPFRVSPPAVGKERGRFRERPLAPAASPLEAAERLLASDAKLDATDVRRQALLAMHHVYGHDGSRYETESSFQETWPTIGEWRKDLEATKATRVRWDPAKRDFVRDYSPR